MHIPTKEIIKASLVRLLNECPMNDITVKMVCQDAGISRQALYNHYYCLPDVLEEVLVDEMERAVGNLDTYHTWAGGFEAILRNLLANKTLLLHVYHSDNHGELMRIIESFGSALVKKGISDCAVDMGYDVTEQDRTFMLNLYMFTFLGLINQWLKEGMRLEPGYIASRCEAMMGLSIRGTLKRLYGTTG